MAGVIAVLGVGVSTNRVSAVLVRRSRILWHADAQRPTGVVLAHVLRDLLSGCPRIWVRSRRVVLAIGPAALRLKPVVGLPALQDDDILAAIVSESPERFFIGEPASLTSSKVHIDRESRAWVAGLDTARLFEAVDACAACGYRVSHVVPTAIALGRVARAGALEWYDGGVRIQVQYEGGELVALRCNRCKAEQVPSFDTVNALREIGPIGAVLADAYGATRVSRRHALAIMPAPDPQVVTVWRRRLVRAAAACLTAAAAAATMPAVVQSIRSRHDQRELARIASAARLAQSRYDSLTLITAQLGQVASFAGARPLSTVLLSEIARVLPESSAVQNITIDSVGTGLLTVVGPHSDAILDALQRVPDVSGVHVLGPIVSDKVSASSLDRVATQFTVLEGSTAR